MDTQTQLANLIKNFEQNKQFKKVDYNRINNTLHILILPHANQAKTIDDFAEVVKNNTDVKTVIVKSHEGQIKEFNF